MDIAPSLALLEDLVDGRGRELLPSDVSISLAHLFVLIRQELRGIVDL